jgi:P-type Cu2+ transporter
LLAAIAACAWWWSRDPGHALMVAVAVLVVTCPCALSLATPAAMLAAAGSLARGGVLVRRLQAFESLAAVDTLVFDKTGTLTRDAMVLGSVEVRSGESPDEAVAMAAALAEHSLHPVSRALSLVAQHRVGGGVKSRSFVCDAVVETSGEGVAGTVIDKRPGANAEPVSLKLGSARFCGVPSAKNGGLQAYLSDGNGLVATFGLTEDIRPEARAVVKQLTDDGVVVHMLSGDNPTSVARVAELAGISSAKSTCSPGDKLNFLRNLQASGHKVAMVGDGLNDGPVLAGANVSFAFGQAVPLAQAQADFVVLGDNLMNVVQTLKLARRTLAIVRQNLWWALIYNAACIPLAVVGFLPAWLAGLGMAASSLLVVLNALRLARGVQNTPLGVLKEA